MPVKSLSSAVRKWPEAQAVAEAAHRWANKVGTARNDIVRIGYFGSCATGRWGAGSDLNLFIELTQCLDLQEGW